MATDFYAQHSGKFNNNNNNNHKNSSQGRGRGRGGRNYNDHGTGRPQQQQGYYSAQQQPPSAPGGGGGSQTTPVYFQGAVGVVDQQQQHQQGLAGLTIGGPAVTAAATQSGGSVLPGLTISNSGAGPSLQPIHPQGGGGFNQQQAGGGGGGGGGISSIDASGQQQFSGGMNVLQMINSQTQSSASTTPHGGGSPLPQGPSVSGLVPAPRSSTSTTAGGASPPPTNGTTRNDLLSELGNVARTSDGKWAVGQFVYVPVTKDGKKEIATITAINGNGSVTIYSERSGYEISVKESVLKRAFLIILDLNGVLVHRKKSKSQGLKRPHVDEFLDFLLTNFVVGVWSSCIPTNGRKIVDHLLSTSEQRKLKFQMWRDDCTPNPTAESPYATKKDLLKVWARYPSSFNETNTVIIDDSADKCSHPKNAFVPSSFEGDEVAVANDVELLRVKKILEEVIDKDDLEPMRREGSPKPEGASEFSRNSAPAPLSGLKIGGIATTPAPSTPPSEKKTSSTPPHAPPTPPRAVVEEDDEEEVLLAAPGAL